MTEPSKVEVAVQFVREQVEPSWLDDTPLTAIILGSGLGALADNIDAESTIAYDSIPGFATSTASGHRGQLILGRYSGARVIAMAGRFHRYEGWNDQHVAFPVRVMRGLGAGCLIASNAAGGVNPKLSVGDVVVIRDHINWLHPRPQRFAPGEPLNRIHRELYSSAMASTALAAARANGFHATEGTYLATLGPNYETRAEYRMMRQIGADAVGMSTVGEVMTAARCGMKVLALSTISNVADPDRPVVADHEEVLEAGIAAAGKLEAIVQAVLR